MYQPGRGFDLFTPLVQMWALIVRLWQPPSTPITPGWRVFLRIAAATIGAAAIAAGALFAKVTFNEVDPWARFATAALTFGIFGLPTSVIAIVIGAILVHAHASGEVAHSAAAVLLAVTYFAQWLLLAWALFRRSRF